MNEISDEFKMAVTVCLRVMASIANLSNGNKLPCLHYDNFTVKHVDQSLDFQSQFIVKLAKCKQD